MHTLTYAAPAKLNLYLEILGRRSDGFHQLETIFQTVELCDVVRLALKDGGDSVLRCDRADLPQDQGNLAWQAARAIQIRRPGTAFAIDIEKRIPVGAGLGGGSSDAAAVLRAAQKLLAEPLQAQEVFAIAEELGSDVPFFLHGGTAHALGRGEVLTALPDLPSLPVTICKPSASLATPAVYKELRDDERGPRQALGAQHWRDQPLPVPLNRLTAPARRLEPAVAELLDWLDRHAGPALLSGSGSACFVMKHIVPPAGIQSWQTSFRPRARLDAVETS